MNESRPNSVDSFCRPGIASPLRRARRAPILTPESWALLHAPVTDANARYAMGWLAPRTAVRMHSGSNTIWFATGGFNAAGDAIALVTCYEELPGGVCLATNGFVEEDGQLRMVMHHSGVCGNPPPR